MLLGKWKEVDPLVIAVCQTVRTPKGPQTFCPCHFGSSCKSVAAKVGYARCPNMTKTRVLSQECLRCNMLVESHSFNILEPCMGADNAMLKSPVQCDLHKHINLNCC